MAHESLGWFDDQDNQVGAGLVLYRQLPKMKKYLAYLPEGPVIDWTDGIGDWLTPLAEHLRSAGAFGIRIGAPVVARRWGADTIKAAIADERITRLSEAIPDEVNHHATRSATGCVTSAGVRRRRRRGSPRGSPASSSSCRWAARPSSCSPG